MEQKQSASSTTPPLITETNFEAALQLTLLSGLSLTTGTFPRTGSMGSMTHWAYFWSQYAQSLYGKNPYPFWYWPISQVVQISGNWPVASRLSAVSSVVLIGKVGVETFWSRHIEKLSQASILGKICVAASVLPVFVLTATFKLTAHCLIKLRSETLYPLTILLGIGPPTLTLVVIRCIVKDLAVKEIGSRVFSELLVFHLWPKNSHGKKINLAMAVFSFFLFSAPLPFMIANPKPDTLKWTQNRSTLFRSMYDRRKWAAELNERV